MTLWVQEDDVRQVLVMPDLLVPLEQAFCALAEGLAANRSRARIVLSEGVLHTMSAALPTHAVLGEKTYTTFREHASFLVQLYSAETGQRLALIEAAWLSQMSAGAVSALATKYMSRNDSTIVGILGAGNQSLTQLMGIAAVRTIQKVYIYRRNLHACGVFCDEVMRTLDIEAIPVAYPKQAVERVEILLTATSSAEPVLDGTWLGRGIHVNAIGSTWPQRRELDTLTLRRAQPICSDSREQAAVEAGDFVIPVKEGMFSMESVIDLCDLAHNYAQGRVHDTDITLFKSVGTALADIAVAAFVYERCLSLGLGKEL